MLAIQRDKPATRTKFVAHLQVLARTLGPWIATLFLVSAGSAVANLARLALKRIGSIEKMLDLA